MNGIYWYNTGTKVLHIEKFCENYKNYGSKQFDSASEAISFSGGQILLCKNCERERDRILRKAVEEKSNK